MDEIYLDRFGVVSQQDMQAKSLNSKGGTVAHSHAAYVTEPPRRNDRRSRDICTYRHRKVVASVLNEALEHLLRRLAYQHKVSMGT